MAKLKCAILDDYQQVALGMDVLAWSRSNTPEKSHELGIGYAATLDDLLAAAAEVTH